MKPSVEISARFLISVLRCTMTIILLCYKHTRVAIVFRFRNVVCFAFPISGVGEEESSKRIFVTVLVVVGQDIIIFVLFPRTVLYNHRLWARSNNLTCRLQCNVDMRVRRYVVPACFCNIRVSIEIMVYYYFAQR